MENQIQKILNTYSEQIQLFNYQIENNHLYIDNLIIKDKGQGYGSKLLSQIIKIAKERNKIVTLYAIPKKKRTKKQNKNAQLRLYSFYKSLGMTQKGNFFYI